MEWGLRLGVLEAETGSLERVLVVGPKEMVPERLAAVAENAAGMSRRLTVAGE